VAVGGLGLVDATQGVGPNAAVSDWRVTRCRYGWNVPAITFVSDVTSAKRAVGSLVTVAGQSRWCSGRCVLPGCDGVWLASEPLSLEA